MRRARVETAWKTQAGHRHALEGLPNEDAAFVATEQSGLEALLIVADGMGGHPRPREAAAAAVAAAQRALEAAPAGELSALLREAVAAGHRAVRTLDSGAGDRAPGSTLSIAAISGGALHVAHVGDGSVYLVRAGRVRPLAGGEECRQGNRPARFLGQARPPEPEEKCVPLAEGDRVLLCTDGLTRYFGEQPGALSGLLTRADVPLAALASQLTAHARPDEYDDDTTVALAEIHGVAGRAGGVGPTAPPGEREEARERGAPEEGGMTRHAATRTGGLLLAALVGAALLGAGFAAGRLTARPAAPGSGPDSGQAEEGPPPAAIARFPRGNLVLLDELGRRLFLLATRDGGTPARGTLRLRAFRVGADGRLGDAGLFHFDPDRGDLTAPDGRRFPVEADFARGTLRVLAAGTLQVASRPAGAAVFIDGGAAGAAPVKRTLAAGRHRIRVEGAGWSRDVEVEVVAEGTVSITLGAP